MNHLLNHIPTCTMVYCGNTYGALQLFDANFKNLSASVCFTHCKLFVTSLNFSIYNYILIKENISLDQCCLNNSVKINGALDIPTLLEVGHSIITAYSTCQDYLFEKFSNPEIKKAIHYLQEHLTESVTLEDLCQLTNLNKSYFCTLFKSHTGYTFSQYLNHARINLSKHLIRDSVLTMHEIAFRCGFNNYPYFCRLFKKIVGESPSNFKAIPR